MQNMGKIVAITQQQICSGSPMNQKTQNQKTTSFNSSNVKEINKSIELLFSKFAAWYGHVWRSNLKEDGFRRFAKKEWQEGLSSFSEVILNKVMVHCREHYELPPSLPQVIQCCRQIRIQTTFYVAKNDHIPADPAVVRSHIQQCRKFLKK